MVFVNIIEPSESCTVCLKNGKTGAGMEGGALRWAFCFQGLIHGSAMDEVDVEENVRWEEQLHRAGLKERVRATEREDDAMEVMLVVSVL